MGSFAGVVVAKLPFEPFSLVQKISHRQLEGEDPTDCSVVRRAYLVYRMCMHGVRNSELAACICMWLVSAYAAYPVEYAALLYDSKIVPVVHMQS